MSVSTILQLVINGLLISGIYGLLSIGLALCFGVVEIVNFAHGEVLMAAMYTSYIACSMLNINFFLALIIGLVIFYFFGVVVQKTIIKPILNAQSFSQIFVTVGLAYVLKNVALMIFKADFHKVKIPAFSSSFQFAGLYFDKARIVAFVFSIITVIGLVIFLRKTYLGLAITSVSQNKKGAALRGIDIHKTYAIAFGIGFLCIAIAGFSLSTIYSVYPTVGDAFGLIAFIIVILGGYNNLFGVLMGALIVGQLESFSGYFLDVHLKEVVYFIAFLIILTIKPQGLLGGSSKKLSLKTKESKSTKVKV